MPRITSPMHVACLSLLCCLLYTPLSFANSLERPNLRSSNPSLALWVQQDSFNQNMDILGYSDNFSPRAAKLDYYLVQKVGFNLSWRDDFNISYTYASARNHVSRFTEPKSISTFTKTQHLRGQYIFYRSPMWLLAAEVGWKKHDSPRVDFYKYDFKNLQVSWPGHVLVSLDAKDSAKLTAVRAQFRTGGLSVGYGIEWRDVEVSASMTSESTTVTSFLAAQAPQATPWQEIHTIQQINLDYNISATWAIALDYQHFDIQRIGYIPRKNKVDFNQNDTVDAYLFWHLAPTLTPYVHAHISRRSTLGDTPLSYNQRSNHKFEHPFGTLSMGAELRF